MTSKQERAMQRRFEERAEREPKNRGWTKVWLSATKPKPASKPAGPYVVTYVLRGGTQKTSRHALAPSTDWLLGRGKDYGALFVIRYWPSRKGWRVIDMREAQCFLSSNMTYPKWVGHRFLDTIFPSEDAAVMAAISLSSA